MPTPQSQVTQLASSQLLRHVWRFLRLWALATGAQILLAGSSLNGKTALVAVAVALGEVLYRLGLPTASLTETLTLLQWVREHSTGKVAQVAIPVEAVAQDVQKGAIDAANEPPLVNGQPQAKP